MAGVNHCAEHAAQHERDAALWERALTEVREVLPIPAQDSSFMAHDR